MMVVAKAELAQSYNAHATTGRRRRIFLMGLLRNENSPDGPDKRNHKVSMTFAK